MRLRSTLSSFDIAVILLFHKIKTISNNEKSNEKKMKNSSNVIINS